MNWEAVQAVAELSAAIGVLLSLAYVAIQIRQNTASVRAGTVARSSEILSRLRDKLWSDVGAARIYERALSGDEVEDSADALRVRLFWVALARDYEAVFYQHLAGQLPDSIWDGWVGEMRLVWCTPGGTDALAAIRVDFLSHLFVEFLDAQVSACVEPPILLLRSRWEKAAKERRERVW